MPTIERDVVLMGKDDNGNGTIDMPLTRWGMVEDTADAKVIPVEGDYIPIFDSEDNGQAKKVPLSAISEIIGGGGSGGGNVIKITFESAFKGHDFTVTNGTDTVTGVVPDALVAYVTVRDCNSTYTISAVADNGNTYSTTVTTGQYYSQYTATVTVFSATINVTAPYGAVVTAVKGSKSFTATANSSNKAVISVNESGTYAISATYDGAASNSVNVTASTNGGTYSASPAFRTLVVTVDSGSSVKAVNGSTTITKSSNGSVTFYLPNTGTWTVTATKSGESTSDTVSVTAYQQYTLTLAYVHIYGVLWDGTSTTAMSRTDDAINFTDPVPAVNGGTGSSPFDNLQPWVGMVKSENSAAGTVVSIPKYWYKLTKSGNTLKIQIADKTVSGYKVSPAHVDRGDGKGERDIVYIGRYHSCSTYKSTTGQAPVTNITRSAARTSIHNLGSTIWQVDLAMRQTIQMLYLVEFADWNSQVKIGYGCGNNSAKQNVGASDSMKYHTGTMQANRTTYGVGVQYRWIEGLWDNVYDWMDGCYYNSNGLNIILNPNNFSDTANGTLVGKPSDGYPTVMSVGTVNGVDWMYPTTANGSNSTYIPDGWYFGASCPCLCSGGNYGQDLGFGVMRVSYCTATYSSGDVGCRLQVLP